MGTIVPLISACASLAVSMPSASLLRSMRSCLRAFRLPWFALGIARGISPGPPRPPTQKGVKITHQVPSRHRRNFQALHHQENQAQAQQIHYEMPLCR